MMSREKIRSNIPSPSTCPVCKSSHTGFSAKKFNYSLFDCHLCQSLYVYPSPSSLELEKFYKSREVTQLSRVCWTDSLDSHKHILDVWKEGLTSIETVSGKASILDIGCGTGQFLAYAQSLGWRDLTGVELVPDVANVAKRIPDTNIYTQDILSLSLPSESFSGIVLWDIAEHLNNLPKILEESYRLLKPGGFIFIGTVHRKGLSMRLLKHDALTVNPPEHLIFFTKGGLETSLKNAGFCIKKVWSFSIYLREWLNVIKKWKGRLGKTDEKSLSYPTTATQTPLFILLMKIANVFLSLTNLGDEIVAIASKPF